MAGDAVWLDVLPSMRGFGASLAKESAKAATDAGKSSGAAWAKTFSGAAGDGGSKKVVDELQRSSQRAKKVVDDQTVALSRARGAQADAAAKVVEAERKLADARESGDPTKVEAAELRLQGARERADAATQKVENGEKSLQAAKSEHVEVTGQLEEATAELGKETEDLTDKTEKQGKAWETVKGGMKTAAVAATAVAAGVATAGAALFSVGSTFDDVSDTIRVGTGASGEALDGLVSSAKNVGTSVPAEFDQVGTTVADVNTRLGLTGETLETVASQALEAGRMLGEEIDISTMSASFNAFQIQGEDTVDAMDHLFQVSQATGVGMNDLASSVAQNAPAVQQLGFSFEETAAMVGNFDKAGLNTEQVMSGMSRSLVNLAKDGEEPADAFRRVVGEIDGFLDAGDKASAIDLASEVFGTRGASQFIGAIESGALAMDDLANVSGMTGDTILGVSEDTMSFGEQWKVFKNEVLVALEPVASRVFGAVSDAMVWFKDSGVPIVKDFAASFQERLQPAVDRIGTLISDTLVPGFKDLVGWLQENQAWLIPVAAGIGAIVAAWGVYQGVMSVVRGVTAAYTLVQAGLNVVMAANPIGIVALALVGLVTALVVAYKNSETFRDIVQGAWQGIQDAALTAWEWVQGVFEGLKEGLSSVGQWFTDRGADIGAAWEAVSGALAAGWDWIDKNVFSPVKDGIAFVATWFDSKRLQIISYWGLLQSGLKAGWQWIDDNVFKPVRRGISGVADWVGDRVDDAKASWNTLKGAFRAVWDWIDEKVFDRFKRGLDRIGGWVSGAVDNVKGLWSGVQTAFRTPINWVIDHVWNGGIKEVFDSVASAVGLDTRLPTASRIGAPTSAAARTRAGGRTAVQALATGGYAPPGWKLVGEEGPELLDLRTPGRVYTADQTRLMQDSWSQDNPPHGGFWDAVGGAWSRTWRGAANMAGQAVSWARGALADAAGTVLRPLRSLMDSTLGEAGRFGELVSGAGNHAIDGLLDWVRGEDTLPTEDPQGRSLRGAKPHVNAGAWQVADAQGGVRLMQAFNQSMAGGHPRGLAVDFIDTVSKLDRIADYGVKNFDRLGLDYIAWQGRLFSGDGWRPQGRGYGNDPQHRWHTHFEWGEFDDGGQLKPGMLAYHSRQMSKPDAVLTDRQWSDMHHLATEQRSTFPEHVTLVDEHGGILTRARVVADERVRTDKMHRETW